MWCFLHLSRFSNTLKSKLCSYSLASEILNCDNAWQNFWWDCLEEQRLDLIILILLVILQTGARLSPPPPNLEKKFSTVGIFNISPIIGVPCNDCEMMGRNWPNKYTIPYSWQIIPTIPHRIKTKTIPPKKLMIPRIRSIRVKNRKVLDGPIVIVSPIRKRTSPSASRAESKKNITPKNSNVTPFVDYNYYLKE